MPKFVEQFPVGNGKFENIDKTPHSLLTDLQPPKSLERIIEEILHFKLQESTQNFDIEAETFSEAFDFGDEQVMAEEERAFFGLKDDDKEHALYWNMIDDSPSTADVEGASPSKKETPKGEVELEALDDISSTDTTSENTNENKKTSKKKTAQTRETTD